MRKLNPELLAQNLEKRIGDDVQSGRVGGAAVKVMQCGKTLYTNYFGYSDCDNKIPLTENNIFRLASMTKPITAAATLIQMSRGLVDLFDPIEKFLPEYKDMDIGVIENGEHKIVGKAKNKVRVLHLLSHSSGIGTGEVGNYHFGRMGMKPDMTITDVVNYFANCSLAFDPYTSELYSPVVAFDVLAKIIEITSGMTYAEFVTKEIFEPLGMNNTTCHPTEEQWQRLICMHNYVDGKGVTSDVGSRFIFEGFPQTYTCAGAGVASNVEDYSKFATMLLNGGNYGGKQIIPYAFARSMGISHLTETIAPGSEMWGLGVRTIVYQPNRLPTGCFGWSGAYGTHFWCDPENQIVAIYMKNSRYDGGAGAETAGHFETDVMASFEN